jgi:hypothetical protein
MRQRRSGMEARDNDLEIGERLVNFL